MTAAWLMKLAWCIEALHQVAPVSTADSAIKAQVLEAPPVQVVLHHIQGPGHGAEQEHLYADHAC